MANVQSGKMIVGLDIGTSKVVALVGEVTADGQLEIVGIGTHPSRGLKKGVVVNIESTVQSIQRAVEEAQLMAGCRIHSAFVGVAGNHIRSLNSHGIVAIRDREVSPADLERVLDAAQAVAIPADQRVLHTLPQDYVIDNQEGVREPLGMSGVRLEAKVHVVTCAVNAAQNVEKCVRRSSACCRMRSTFSTEISSLSSRYGSLVMKSTAPALTAMTASSIVPCPVRMMIGRSGRPLRIARQISIPLRRFGPRSRSSTTRSASLVSSQRMPSSPSSKLTTLEPFARNTSPSRRRTSG
jgi:hypothetical protein